MFSREEMERIKEQLSEAGLIEEPKKEKEVYLGIDFEEGWGFNKSLQSYSDRELRDELKRRKSLKAKTVTGLQMQYLKFLIS